LCVINKEPVSWNVYKELSMTTCLQKILQHAARTTYPYGCYYSSVQVHSFKKNAEKDDQNML